MSAAFSLSLVANTKELSKAGSIVQKTNVNETDEDHAMTCKQSHLKKLDESKLSYVDKHQVRAKGERKCCQCAYNSGYQQGSLLQEFISLDVDSLGDIAESEDGRYKSVHQAFALGYQDGVNSVIKNQ